MGSDVVLVGLGATAVVGLIIGGAILMSGPSKPKQDEAAIYTDVTSCSKDHPADECQTAFDAAKASQDKAPKFANAASCEDVYGKGQCVPRGSGSTQSDGFSPFMTGFMLGHILNGGYSYQPVYIDRSRHVYSGGGYVGTYGSSGRVTGYTGPSTYSAASPSAPRAGVAPAVSARGGFGSSAGVAAESAGG